MPCAFYLPAVMMIHCALSVQHTQRLAKSFGSTNASIRGGNNNNSPTEQKSDSDNTKESSIPSGPDPYILVGDFNIKPDSNMYRMITEGSDESVIVSHISQSPVLNIFEHIHSLLTLLKKSLNIVLNLPLNILP